VLVTVELQGLRSTGESQDTRVGKAGERAVVIKLIVDLNFLAGQVAEKQNIQKGTSMTPGHVSAWTLTRSDYGKDVLMTRLRRLIEHNGRLEILAVSVHVEGDTSMDHYDEHDDMALQTNKPLLPIDPVVELSKKMQKQEMGTKKEEEPSAALATRSLGKLSNTESILPLIRPKSPNSILSRRKSFSDAVREEVPKTASNRNRHSTGTVQNKNTIAVHEHDSPRFRSGKEPALGDLGEELAAFGEFHDEEDLGFGGEDLREVHDVGVTQAVHDSDLPLHVGSVKASLVQPLLAHYFDRLALLRPRVPPSVHLRERPTSHQLPHLKKAKAKLT
ncbi:unnamed protein product, partial [Brassica rapa]